MAINLHALTDADLAYLKERLGRLDKIPSDRPRGSDGESVGSSPDNYFFKIPDASTSIPARSGTTLGSLVDCEVYKLDLAGEITIATDVKIKVWNPYLCKLYRQAAPYFTASRNKYGLWICEKPRLWHKGKVDDDDIEPGSSGNIELYFNGAVSSPLETVLGYLNWMAGEKVSDTKEVMVHFSEDEDKWWISNAECETA